MTVSGDFSETSRDSKESQGRFRGSFKKLSEDVSGVLEGFREVSTDSRECLRSVPGGLRRT